MSSPFLGEIRPFPFNFAPKNWAQCNGQLLPISQYPDLFTVLGTQYGGDGTSTFGLPNLQGSVPMHTDSFSGGGRYPIGTVGGAQQLTVLTTNLPGHSHALNADGGPATTQNPSGNNLASPPRNGPALYVDSAASPPGVALAAASLQPAGGDQPISILQPSLCVNFCIALTGIFPSR